MKELIKAITNGMYDYYSKQFTILTEVVNAWEVRLTVVIEDEATETVTVDEWGAYAMNHPEFLESFEEAITDNFERLKSKYLLNHHHRLSA